MKRPRYFQWIAGENSGTVSQLDFINEVDGEYFYNFKDGEICNLRFISQMTNSAGMLKDKFMVEILNPRDPWIATTITNGSFKDANTQENVDIPPLEDITSATGQGSNINIDNSSVGKVKYVAPKYNGPMYELPRIDDYYKSEEVVVVPEKPVEKPVEKTPVVTSTNTGDTNKTSSENSNFITTEESSSSIYLNTKTENSNVNDPVYILSKNCKKKDVEISITITMSLPSKSVYEFADSEFENGGEKFIDYLVNDLDTSNVIASIKEGISKAYIDN